MKSIYKYIIEITDVQSVKLAEDAKILAVGNQFGSLVLWAQVDTESKTKNRKILIFGTGNPFNAINPVYVGTVQMGNFVWHIYEELG